VLLLSCKECGGNYFSAASAGICPDCGADLEPGSPARLALMDVNGNGRHSLGDGVAPREFHRLWQSLLAEEPLRTENA
jgi:rRNA maturation protein Nop10